MPENFRGTVPEVMAWSGDLKLAVTYFPAKNGKPSLNPTKRHAAHRNLGDMSQFSVGLTNLSFNNAYVGHLGIAFAHAWRPCLLLFVRHTLRYLSFLILVQSCDALVIGIEGKDLESSWGVFWKLCTFFSQPVSHRLRSGMRLGQNVCIGYLGSGYES